MKMKYLLLITFITICVISNAQDKAKMYIDCYKNIAIQEMKRTGVPACISLAQGLVESNCGEGDLCKRSNNHFGIKCKNEWTGDKVYHDDDFKGECFRSYSTGADSYRDHSDFLKNRPNYSFLFNLDPSDYKAWAYGLKKAGYATETSYPQKLLKVINNYNLNQYTLIALNKLPDTTDSNLTMVTDNSLNTNTNVDTALTIVDNKTSASGITSTSSTTTTTITTKTTTSTTDGTTIVKDTILTEMIIPVSKTKGQLITPSTTEKVEDSVTIINTNTTINNIIATESDTKMDSVFTVNHTKAIYVNAGTATLLIAKHYNISLASLFDMNDMPNIDITPTPQIVYLEPKQSKGATTSHVVKENETLFDISQIEGVRLNKILEYNKLKKGSIVAVGKIILLQPQIAGKSTK